MELLAVRGLPTSRQQALPKSRRLALVAISAGFLMITLDATIVNVALGAIGADLGGAASLAQWVVDGYTVAFASLLLLAGSLADRVGVRRGFVIRHADESPRRRRSFDLPGQVLAMFSLAALTAAFINAGAHGWAARGTLALVICGGLASAAFVLLERTIRRPLIDPAILGDTTV